MACNSWFLRVLILGSSLVGLSQSNIEGGIKLAGSDRGMEGKLKIYRNGEWWTVCNEGWTLEDASTACRQLGYPKGVMITRANDGSFDDGTPSRLGLRAPGCTPSNDRLTDCPDFQFQENLSCAYEVIMSCYVDDFRGCFQNIPVTSGQANFVPPAGTPHSIESCLAFCREIMADHRFVALAGPRCICEANDDNLGSAVPSTNCGAQCTGDPMETCGVNDGGTDGYFAVWPVTVGESGGSLTTADGCLYSPNFPGPYPTSDAPSTDQYTVTLPTTAYVALMVKTLDLFDGDSLLFTDLSSGTAIPISEPSVRGAAVIPVTSLVSSFTVDFNTAADSPDSENYGFVVCYKSLAELPPDPTTMPTTVPPPDPTTQARTQSPPDPSTQPPVQPMTLPPVTLPPVTLPPVLPTVPPVVLTVPATTPDDALPTTAVEVAMTTIPDVETTLAPSVTTAESQVGNTCAASHGAPVQYRRTRGLDDVILLNTGEPFNCTGYLTSVSFFSAENRSFELGVWRRAVHVPGTDDDTYRYTLSAKTLVEGAPLGVPSRSLDREEWLSFAPGDVMGVLVQTSPLVFNEAAGGAGDGTTPWMSWPLEDGSDPEDLLSVNATGVNQTYSLSVTIQAKEQCWVPVLPNSARTDAIVPYVYEGEIYTLRCRYGYQPLGGPDYLCQTDGSFDSPLECESTGIFYGLTFTQIIILLVVLMLMCLAVFVISCAMVCCRSSGAEAAKVPAPKEPIASVDQPDTGVDVDDSMNDNQFLLINIEDEPGDDMSNLASEPADVFGMEDDGGVSAVEAPTEGTAVIDNPVHVEDDASQ